jgi:hypothetical protein
MRKKLKKNKRIFAFLGKLISNHVKARYVAFAGFSGIVVAIIMVKLFFRNLGWETAARLA